MKLKIKIGLIALISLSVVILGIYYALSKQQEKEYENKGAILIQKVENFRTIEKRLPENLTELGVEEPMDEGPYYEKLDSLNYKVYFNIGFDNSKVYYSELQEWKQEQ